VITPDPSSNEVLRLVAILRQQDQLIYRISQCANFAEMRPLIAQLCEGTFGRMQDESDRILTLMVGEIRRVYTYDYEATEKASPTEPKRPRLEGPRDAGGEKDKDREGG